MRALTAASHINLYFLIDTGEFDWDVSQADVFFQKGAGFPMSLAHPLTVNNNVVPVTGNTSFGNFKPNQLAL